MMPLGPSATSSTSGEFGSIVMSTSPAARATAAGESAALAPAPGELLDGRLAPAVDDQRRSRP